MATARRGPDGKPVRPGEVAVGTADVLVAKAANSANYFCSNADCERHVLTEDMEAEFPLIQPDGSVERMIMASHRFAKPDGAILRVCDICRTAIELVAGQIPDGSDESA